MIKRLGRKRQISIFCILHYRRPPLHLPSMIPYALAPCHLGYLPNQQTAECRPVLALKFKHNNNHPLESRHQGHAGSSKSKTTVGFLGLIAQRRSGGSSAPATTLPRGTAARWSGEMLDLTPNELGDFIDRLFE